MVRLTLISLLISASLAGQDLVVGSKLFSESRLLCEIMAQAIENETGLEVERKYGLGGTLICFEALKNGAIDIYPEYSGTIRKAIFNNVGDTYEDELDSVGIRAAEPFGYNNAYVMITHPGSKLKKISDLKDRTDLRLGFSNEFVKRGDGYPALNKAYDLGLGQPKGMDHGLAYKALADRKIDVTDAYGTDGKLETFGFQFLEDDLNFFPQYLALPLVNESTASEYPEILKILAKIEINEETMRELNFRVEVKKESMADVAHEYLMDLGLATKDQLPITQHPIVSQTIEHLQLTFLATFIAILIAVPLGVYISFKPKASGTALASTGIIQTIPSLALLGFMIPLFGIGFLPAVVALFLYALLPIVRNTFTGLQDTDPILIEAGKAMGMTNWQILTKIRLPLAASVILAGIRTALTINIGTATLAAFIGAGGLGESIITGINLNDNSLILRGAIPAAVLALLADFGMGLIEKKLRPKS